jgi:26S proteasome regulatory subunit N10
MIFTAKTQSNPESTVGAMTLAGDMYPAILKKTTYSRPEVKVTMTKDLGKILTAMHSIKISGSPNFMSAIQIAQVSPLYVRLLTKCVASSQTSTE